MPKKSSKHHKRGRGNGDEDDNEQIGSDTELPSTAGALGREKPRRRKKPELDVDERVAQQNAPSTGNVLPAKKETPKPAKTNLAGAPDLQARSTLGVKSIIYKHLLPTVPTAVNVESHIHFGLQTGAYEWVHFPKNAISMKLLAMARNINYDPAAADQRNRTEFWPSQRANPQIFMDPDVGGRGFFSRIEVIINDRPVPTNDSLGALFVHYSRYQAIFASQKKRSKKKQHFKRLNEWAYIALPGPQTKLMRAATDAFANRGDDDTEGQRLYVPLDGIFPFDLKCLVHQAIEGVLPQDLYFPPSTKFEVRLHFQQTKTECLFHNEVTHATYYTNDPVQPAHVFRLTIKEATLEYESVELFPEKHSQEMQRYKGRGMGVFDYDIPRGQHQNIAAGVSYAENTFQIPPYCRSLMIMFHPTRAVLYQPHLRRPLSGWSTFPLGCTKMQVEYAQESLTGRPLVNFGIRGAHSDISMTQYFNYLSKLNLTDNFDFDDYFPNDAEDHHQSLVQALVFDVRHLMLNKIQLLRIGMEFSNNQLSPEDHQIAVVSIHPNGRATVRNISNDGTEWYWEFLQQN